MAVTGSVPWGHCFVDADDPSRPAELVLRQVDAKTFALGSSLRYVGATGIADLPEAAVVLRPEDLGLDHHTDLASVPTALQWFVSRYGVHTPAALLHDRLTGEPGLDGVSEQQADRFFRFMLRELKVPWLRRWMMWAAVALRTRWEAGGARRWSVALWVLASLAGQAVTVVGALQGQWGLVAVAALAPLAFGALWGRQYGAGLVAAYTAPWVAPPTLFGFLGYLAYRGLENLARAAAWLRHRGSPAPAAPEPAPTAVVTAEESPASPAEVAEAAEASAEVVAAEPTPPPQAYSEF